MNLLHFVDVDVVMLLCVRVGGEIPPALEP